MKGAAIFLLVTVIQFATFDTVSSSTKTGLKDEIPSPGHLAEMFSEIYLATGIYPDDKNIGSGYLLIVNVDYDQCVTVYDSVSGNGVRVLNSDCNFQDASTNQHFYLKHVGEGFITFTTEHNACFGAGDLDGSLVYTGDWCDSPSHQFAMVFDGAFVHFEQKETGNCLTATGNETQIEVSTCNLLPDQTYRVCNVDGTKCWPSQRPE